MTSNSPGGWPTSCCPMNLAWGRRTASNIVGMKSAICLCALSFALQLSACDKGAKPAEHASVARERHFPSLHRFVNVSSPSSPGVALDTVSGQYCKTWEWTYKTATMNGGLDTLPTCLSVFHSIPAGQDDNDPLGILQPDANNPSQ